MFLSFSSYLFFFVLGSCIIYYIIIPFSKRFVLPASDLSRYNHKKRWALITGGTDGIGKALVLELLKRDWKHFIILGRSPEKASNLENIMKKNGAKVHIILRDLTKMDHQQMDDLIESLFNLYDIALLINNLSITPDVFPGPFIDHETDEVSHILNINIIFPTKLIHSFIKNNARKKSALMIISSFAGTVSTPLMSLYSATKSFQLHLGQSLATECRSENIDVTVIVPGATVPTSISKSLNQEKASWLTGTSSPESVAKGSLDVLGIETIWSPTWVHDIQSQIFTRLPEYLQQRILMMVNSVIYKRMKIETSNRL